MKHIFKILTLLVAITAFWIGLLEASVVPRSYAWLLPVYFIVSLGCYGLLMVGVGLMRFPTCPQEAGLLHKVAFPSQETRKQLHRMTDWSTLQRYSYICILRFGEPIDVWTVSFDINECEWAIEEDDNVDLDLEC